MDYIRSLGDIFVFRCKQNLKVFYQKYPEKHKIWLPISELPHHVHSSKLYTDLEFTKNKYVFNLAYCKSKDHKKIHAFENLYSLICIAKSLFNLFRY